MCAEYSIATPPPQARGRRRAGRRALRRHEGDRLDLDARARDKPGDLHRRARGRAALERAPARAVVLGVVLGARHEAEDLHDVAHPRAGLLERGAHAREALVGLGREALADDRAVLERADLAGHEDPAPRTLEAH